MKCRFCKTTLTHEFVDLGNAPPSNSFLTEEQLDEPEIFYPLKLYVCENCFLVQISEYKKSIDIFSNEYIYFSSFSTSWLEHARQYVEMAAERFGLTTKSKVIEIAANDGYLLQYFQEKAIPCLGIEPAKKTAEKAKEKGIEIITEFFGVSLAKKLAINQKADLLLGNNVLAHVPDINNFVAGLKILLAGNGRITMEFPHLMRLIELNQFDTIYHEHFSYLSLNTVQKIFRKHSLEIYDVEEISTHGGSVRIYATHYDSPKIVISDSVNNLLEAEKCFGLSDIRSYKIFQSKANNVKYNLLHFLIEEKKKGKRIAAYGAAAKGNTLLNYCGIKNDMIDFVVDASPHKQGKYLPGSHLAIVNEGMMKSTKPDYVIIFPWNIKTELIDQLKYINDWDGKFIIAVPDLKVINA